MTKQALISVSDKTNLIELCKTLKAQGYNLLSTGGSAKLIKEHQIDVRDVSEYTQFPEMMDGRLKTLHPKVAGGLLARLPKDEAAMTEHGIEAIDIVICNLYPFQQTVQRKDSSFAEAIENIDIGGPTMIRAAAKNHSRVAVVVNPNDYEIIIKTIEEKGHIDTEMRQQLAVKAFEHTAHYDTLIAQYLGSAIKNDTQPNLENTESHIWPEHLTRTYEKSETDLRYGENPHQKAALYKDVLYNEPSIVGGELLQGKPLSFNNLNDAETALECVMQYDEDITCVICKHANPCGVAKGQTAEIAYERAYSSDPVSAFGGIIAFNTNVDKQTANTIIKTQFVELIIAPSFSPDTLAIFKTKPNIRVLAVGDIHEHLSPAYELRSLRGGLLVQDRDVALIETKNLQVASKIQPDEDLFNDLIFAWKVAKFVKSNAIVYAKNDQTIGIGAGQTSRVAAADFGLKMAEQSGFNPDGAVMASDAFFPFRDGIDAAAKAGIRAIIQPGGSMRDQEVIDAANEHKMIMVFTGLRHFRH